MFTTFTPPSPLSAAVEMSGFLGAWVLEPDLATADRVEPTMASLAEVIEALPPHVADAGRMCFLRNALASARALFNAGEWGAAGYQLRQLTRKLGLMTREASAPNPDPCPGDPTPRGSARSASTKFPTARTPRALPPTRRGS